MKLKRIFSFTTLIGLIVVMPTAMSKDYYGSVFGGFITTNAAISADYNCAGDCTVYQAGAEQYRDTLAQTGLNAGAGIGFWYKQSTKFKLGAELEGMVDTGNAAVTFSNDHIFPSDSSIRNRFALRYLFNAMAVISANITEQLASYFKIGPSVGVVYSEIHFIPGGDSGGFPEFSFKQDNGYIGWAIGLGLTQQFTKNIGGFIEYEHMNYGKHSLTSLTTPSNNIGFPNTYGLLHRRYQNIAMDAVKVGVTFNLAAV